LISLNLAICTDRLQVMNGIGIAGRLPPSLIADRLTGPLNIMIPFTILLALLLYCWAAVHSITGIWIFAAFYGIIAACSQGLFPAVLSSLTDDLTKRGTRMGMGFACVGIASATGSPLGGALVQRANGSYLYAQIWAGSSILCGAMVLTAARIAKTGWQWKGRV
jgi:MFS family permease